MEPGLTVIVVLLILSVACLLLCTVKKNAGTIPPMIAMVMGFGITMLSTRLNEVDGFIIAFVALLGLLVTGLAGSVLINGEKS